MKERVLEQNQEREYLVKEIDELKHSNSFLQNNLQEVQVTSQRTIRRIESKQNIETNSFEAELKNAISEKDELKRQNEALIQRLESLKKQLEDQHLAHSLEMEELERKMKQISLERESEVREFK